MGLHQGGLNHSYWEAESCGVANVCRSSDVFEETAVLRNWSCHPFKVRGKKVDREDDSVIDVSFRQLGTFPQATVSTSLYGTMGVRR